MVVMKDNNEKVWKSVTNFSKKRTPNRAHPRRQNIALMHQMGGAGAGVDGSNGSITDKMRQSMKLRGDDLLEGQSGTLKGNLLKTLSRQRSLMHVDNGVDSETSGGLKDRVKRTPSGSDRNSPKALLPMNKNMSSSSRKDSQRVDDSDHSTDSEEESHTHSEQQKTKRVGVNDLFTVETVAAMKTPVNHKQEVEVDNVGKDTFDYRMESATSNSTSTPATAETIEMTKDNTPKESSTIPLIDDDDK